tara:strand:+ start:261 stop:1010 length:750 start_codon:yes stop_codon:yes gene_type:complete
MSRLCDRYASKLILIIGSGPNATEVQSWQLSKFDKIVVINNAWRVTNQWTDLIYPHDFSSDRLPEKLATGQRLIDETHFVPAQNHYGGFVYAGGTMAYTAAYWVLREYAPTEICFIGCDMHYPETGPTHFYGTGTPDPLREDISLTSLEGSSARFLCLAARQKCRVFNLSNGPTRLIFPRKSPHKSNPSTPLPVIDAKMVADCLQTEQELGYFVADGRYWLEADKFCKQKLKKLNKNWLSAAGHVSEKK